MTRWGSWEGWTRKRGQDTAGRAWALPLTMVVLGCSPTIESGEGSFESGQNVTTAGASEDDEGSTGEGTTAEAPDPGPSAACMSYLSCLGAITSDQLGKMENEFGEGGACYESLTVDACGDQCDAAFEALVAALGLGTLPAECGGSAEPAGPENTDATCSDGVDNDQNGFVDCDDPKCNDLGVSICIDPGEDNNAACSDGIDNDGDSHTDCDDYDCSMNTEVTVCSTAEDTQAACSDGVDNDGDSHVDCDDYDCSMNPDIICSAESTDATCSDNQDNDGDDFIDCDDYDCSMNPAVTVCD